MKLTSCYANLCSAIALVLYFSCDSAKEENRIASKFPVINPHVMDTAVATEYVATINSVQFVEVRTKVSGYLEKPHVDEGHYVMKGQLLFTLGSHDYKGELIQAQSQLKSAIADAKATEVDISNITRLVTKGIVSNTELEIAGARHEAALSKIEEAKALVTGASLKLSMTQIRAPFSGTIGRIPNKVGSLIEEGSLLTTISDNSAVFAYYNVSEKEYLDFKHSSDESQPGSVQLILANNQLHKHEGLIETTDGRIDQNTGTITFRARFANPDNLLKHGSSGKVKVLHELKKAIIIPQKSTFEIQDKLFVYVLDSANVVHMRSFIPKMRLPHVYIVENGIAANDRLIYEGIQLISEGEKVDPEFTVLFPKQ